MLVPMWTMTSNSTCYFVISDNEIPDQKITDFHLGILFSFFNDSKTLISS
jgi:hypothetical protein